MGQFTKRISGELGIQESGWYAFRMLNHIIMFWTALWAGPTLCCASTLYTLDVSGTVLKVDQQTGQATAVIEGLNPGSWTGLSSSPQDPSELFALFNPTPPTFDDPQFSALSRIDLPAGEATLFPFFQADDLGLADEIFSTGVAISSQSPGVAVVVGSTAKKIPPVPLMWTVDLLNGRVVEPAKTLTNVSRLEALTFGPDGSTLFATNQDGELISINQETGEASMIGDPELTLSLTGIAFRPEDGVLFAIDARREDRLVTLDPQTGAHLTTLGKLGIAGPEGLAFVPSTNSLDCNLDGLVNTLDLDCANFAGTTTQLLAELGLFPGDLDGQNGVGFGDFLVLADNYGQAKSKYTEGDINSNGMIDFQDFVVLADNFGRQQIAASVPEPATAVLAVCGLVILCWLRQGRLLIHVSKR